MFRFKSQTADQSKGNQPPSSDVVTEEAQINPGGWVYEIGGGYHNNEEVPPQAIKGAWKVDGKGEITNEYRANPNYDPTFLKPAS